MSKVNLPEVWKKSICYGCKFRKSTLGLCEGGIIMAKRGKRCKSHEREEVE